jgi:hypothetical protein
MPLRQEAAKVSRERDPKLGKIRKKRPVLIIVEKWPDGTMAFKFGSALMSALGQRRDEVTLVQLGPERIFRIETDVSEVAFRSALKMKDVSYHGSIQFSECLTEEALPAL